MGFLGDLFGTNSDYQYQTGGINNAQNQWDAIQQQKMVNERQQMLGNDLMDQAHGGGPNPAQEMLARATAANNRQGAGFIASQKGINPALATRLAAQNAAAGSQDAASQGAILQANQSLAAQNQLQGLYGTMGQQNISQQGLGLQGQNAQNNVNAGISQSNAANNAGIVGGILGAAGTVLAAAEGGEIPKEGSLHQFLDGMLNAKSGGQVPGKPKVMGNSYKNDTVHAMVSPGEVVIPNSVMQSKDPVSNAAKFVQAVMAKKQRMVK